MKDSVEALQTLPPPSHAEPPDPPQAAGEGITRALCALCRCRVRIGRAHSERLVFPVPEPVGEAAPAAPPRPDRILMNTCAARRGLWP